MIVSRSRSVTDRAFRFGANAWANLNFDAFGELVQSSHNVDETGEVVTLVQYRDQTHAKKTQGRIGHHRSHARLGNLLSGFGDLARKLGSGEERDVIPGEQIIAVFTPFLLDLLAQGLSRKARNLHRDNLWLLGGEIIRDINETPKLRTRPVGELIPEVIANDEGPLIHGGFSEQEQRSFDSTCKKLNRFLAAHADSKQR